MKIMAQIYSTSNSTRSLYSTANDPQIGRQNNRRCGPLVIPAENEEWHGVWFHMFIIIMAV